MKSPFETTNVRPSNWNEHTHNKGDCTTRSMTYCLNGAMSYEEIEAEQYRIGKEKGRVRNATGVWDEIMLRRGYTWIQLEKRVSRQMIANYLSNFENAMITISRGHACAIHMGKVIDTWDSRSGRVYGILVKITDFDFVFSVLGNYGIHCSKTDFPKPVQTRKYRRRFF